MVLETQVFLNYYLSEELPDLLLVDGVQGNKTNNAIEIAINKLKNKFSKENLIWDNSFNFIGLRTSNKITDRYDDWFILYYAKTLVAFPASTKSGKPAIMKYWNRFIKGIRGFGTIKENQQIDYLLVRGTNSGWSSWTGGLGFLFQDRKIQIYRDPNTDNIIDTSVFVTSENDGFNVHSWKNVNAFPSNPPILGTRATSMNLPNAVSNISEGCQVTLENYWNRLFVILKNNSRNVKGEERITYTIIDK